MKKAIVITLGVIIGVTGVLAICAHLADAARLALYVPEDEDDEGVLPALTEGQVFEPVAASVTEHFTSPPKPYTEAICCERGIRNRP